MKPDDLDRIEAKDVRVPEIDYPLGEDDFTGHDRDALVAALREAWAERDRMRDGGACDNCQERERNAVIRAERQRAMWQALDTAVRKVTAERDEAEAALDRANRLLRYALHLRINGENAPGGNETWQQFDRDCDEHLRSVEGES